MVYTVCVEILCTVGKLLCVFLVCLNTEICHFIIFLFSLFGKLKEGCNALLYMVYDMIYCTIDTSVNFRV